MQLAITSTSSDLIFAGVLLFFLGLAQGIFIPFMKNPRMALSAHTDGVQSGLALSVFGIVWSLLELSQLWLQITYYSALLGFYGLWLGITSASISGASKALPMAGAGYSASPTGEMLAIILTRLGGTLILLSSGLVLAGLI